MLTNAQIKKRLKRILQPGGTFYSLINPDGGCVLCGLSTNPKDKEDHGNAECCVRDLQDLLRDITRG